MSKQQNLTSGVAWYRRDQYGLLRALSSDAVSMAETYEGWLAGATQMLGALEKHGVSFRRVEVDVRELAAWCQQQGRPLDGAARSEFVAQKLRHE